MSLLKNRYVFSQLVRIEGEQHKLFCAAYCFGSRSLSEFVSQLCHRNAWPWRTGKTRFEDQVRKAGKTKLRLKLRSHGTGRIFDRLINFTGHYVHTGPFNIFAPFTRHFERLRVYFFARLGWLCVNGTPKRRNFWTGRKLVRCRVKVAWASGLP